MSARKKPLWIRVDAESLDEDDESLYPTLLDIAKAARQGNTSAKLFKDIVKFLVNILEGQHDMCLYLLVCSIVEQGSHYPGISENFVRKGIIPALIRLLNRLQEQSDSHDQEAVEIHLLVSMVTLLCVLLRELRMYPEQRRSTVEALGNLCDFQNDHIFRYGEDAIDSMVDLLLGKTLSAQLSNISQEESDNLIRNYLGDVPDWFKLPSEVCLVNLWNIPRRRTDASLNEQFVQRHLAWPSGDVGDKTSRHEVVGVTHVDESFIWIIIDESSAQKVQTILEEFSPKTFHLPAKDWPTVCICATARGRYRGQIMDVDADGARVFALDYGFVDYVEWKNVSPIPVDAEVKIYKPLAIPCKLEGITAPPISVRLLEMALGALCNITHQASLTAPLFRKYSIEEKLLDLCVCPEPGLQLRAIRVLSNLAHARDYSLTCNRLTSKVFIREILGVCNQHVNNICSKSDTDGEGCPESASIVKASLAFFTNALQADHCDKCYFKELGGPALMLRLVYSDASERVKVAAFKVLRVYLGHLTLPRDEPETSPRKVSEGSESSPLSSSPTNSDKGTKKKTSGPRRSRRKFQNSKAAQGSPRGQQSPPASPRNKTAGKRSPPVGPRNKTPEKRSPPVSPRNKTAGKRSPPVSPRNKTPEKRSPPVSPRNKTPEKRSPPVSPRNKTPEKRSPPVSPRNKTAGKRSPPVSPRNKTAGKQSSPVSPRDRGGKKQSEQLCDKCGSTRDKLTSQNTTEVAQEELSSRAAILNSFTHLPRKEEPLPDFFVQGKILDLANSETCELRVVRQLRDISADTAAKIVCGFLNSNKGGHIYYGLQESAYVTGLHMSRSERDELRMGVDDIMAKNIMPAVIHSMYDVQFVPVAARSGSLQEETRRLIPNLYVAVIKISGSRDIVYSLSSAMCFFRRGHETVEVSTNEAHEAVVLREEALFSERLAAINAEIARLQSEVPGKTERHQLKCSNDSI